MGSTKLTPLLTNTASTTLAAWLYCTARADQPLQGRITQGWQQFDQGNIVAAITCFQAVLIRAQALGNASLVEIAQNSLQFIAQALTDWDVSLQKDSENLDAAAQPQTVAASQTGHDHLTAAEAASQRTDYPSALQHLDRALHQFTAGGDLTGVGQSLSAMARVHLTTAEYSRSLSYGQAAIAVLEDCEARSALAQTLQTFGMAHFHLANWASAQANFEQAAVLSHRLDDTRGEAIALQSLGQVYVQQKTFMFALATYEAALDCCLELPPDTTQELTAAILQHIGQLHEAMGYRECAITPYRDALDHYRYLGDWVKATQLLQHLGRLYEAQGQYAMALECYHQLQQIPALNDRPD